jgi:hypothetical protein
MQLIPSTQGAVEIIRYLRDKEGYIKTEEIRQAVNKQLPFVLSYNTINTICRNLANFGYLDVYANRSGGVKLVKEPNILELITAIEGFVYSDHGPTKKVMKHIATALKRPL